MWFAGGEENATSNWVKAIPPIANEHEEKPAMVAG